MAPELPLLSAAKGAQPSVFEEALLVADTTTCRQVTVYDYIGRADHSLIVLYYLRGPY